MDVLRQQDQSDQHHPEAQDGKETDTAKENEKHSNNESNPSQLRSSRP